MTTQQPKALALTLADMLADSKSPGCFPAAKELRRLHESNTELLAALEKLARLGNGERYGNSEGNTIARAAINKAERTTP